jgi:hypothetical protein
MLSDDVALVSDLSWLSFSYLMNGDKDSADYYERLAENLLHHPQSGQDWDTTINRFDFDSL